MSQKAVAATTVVVAHAAVADCVTAAGRLVLPFEVEGATPLMSEATFGRCLGDASRPAQPKGPYGAGDIARLSGLPADTCRVLALFDVLTPVEGGFGYQDVATARQVAHLLDQGLGLPAIVRAGLDLGRRGLRVSQVRLAESPWGEIVQRVGERIARFDGQFALVLDEEVSSADASFARGQADEEAGDLAGAERWYGRAERLDKADPVIPFNRGNILAGQSRVGEAMLAYRQALARDPAFAEAAFNLAHLLEGQGRDEEALDQYGRALDAHPAYAQALFNRARLFTKANRYREALPVWEGFVRAAPDDPDVQQARRMALLCRLELRRADAAAQ